MHCYVIVLFLQFFVPVKAAVAFVYQLRRIFIVCFLSHSLHYLHMTRVVCIIAFTFILLALVVVFILGLVIFTTFAPILCYSVSITVYLVHRDFFFLFKIFCLRFSFSLPSVLTFIPLFLNLLIFLTYQLESIRVLPISFIYLVLLISFILFTLFSFSPHMFSLSS